MEIGSKGKNEHVSGVEVNKCVGYAEQVRTFYFAKRAHAESLEQHVWSNLDVGRHCWRRGCIVLLRRVVKVEWFCRLSWCLVFGCSWRGKKNTQKSKVKLNVLDGFFLLLFSFSFFFSPS